MNYETFSKMEGHLKYVAVLNHEAVWHLNYLNACVYKTSVQILNIGESIFRTVCLHVCKCARPSLYASEFENK